MGGEKGQGRVPAVSREPPASENEMMMAKKEGNGTITTVTKAHHESGIVEAPDS